VGAYIEALVGGAPDRIPLSGDRLVIGQTSSNDLPLPFDTTVSRLHAVLENLPAGWCIRDLNSRNGTFLNGERIWGERPLRPGDEIRVGRTMLVFRTDAPSAPEEQTAGAEDAPELTRRERDVLLALCAPLMSEDVFHQPASIHDIAEELVVTDAAVKQHLLRLYDKFGIRETGETRRLRLANESIRRGAVSMAEIQEWVKRRRAR
jgi:pSer/pThr/pTyr-binding forkhead associated (FHA) protein